MDCPDLRFAVASGLKYEVTAVGCPTPAALRWCSIPTRENRVRRFSIGRDFPQRRKAGDTVSHCYAETASVRRPARPGRDAQMCQFPCPVPSLAARYKIIASHIRDFAPVRKPGRILRMYISHSPHSTRWKRHHPKRWVGRCRRSDQQVRPVRCDIHEMRRFQRIRKAVVSPPEAATCIRPDGSAILP
jgi:hypothetical protein